MSSLNVRPIRETDIHAVTAIYAHAVLHGSASFEVEPPDEAEMARRVSAVVEAGFPYLVGEKDGMVFGYAYAGLYRTRPAYWNSAENSVYVSPDAKVTERFTMQDKDTIHYAFTVEDSVAYSQPWKGELVFRRSPDRIYEYACHEGNYSVPNILGGAREMEREGRKQPVITSSIGRLDRPTEQNMPKP